MERGAGDAATGPSTPSPPPKRGVEVSNKIDKECTLVKVVYTPRPGLFADLCLCVDAQGLRILRAEISGAGALRAYRFWVVDDETAFKLEHAHLNPISLAIRDAVVKQGAWHSVHGADAVKTSGEAFLRVDAPRHALSLRAPDRVGLLRDVAATLLHRGVDFDSLRTFTAWGSDSVPTAVVEGSVVADERVAERVGTRVSGGAEWEEVMRALRDVAVGGLERGGVPASAIATMTGGRGSPTRTAHADDAMEGAHDDERGGGGGTISRAKAGAGMRKAESIADLNRFQTEWRPPGGTAGGGAGGAASGAIGAMGAEGFPRSASPAPAGRTDGVNGGGAFGAFGGGAHAHAHGHGGLHRSFSVADMNANITSGGHGADRGSGSPFRPGMPQSITHSASVKDLSSLGKATAKMPRLAELESDERMSDVGGVRAAGATSPDIIPEDGTWHDDGIARNYALANAHVAPSPPGADAAKSLFGEGAFPDLPPPRRDLGAGDYALLRELGRGLCGTVYLARERATGNIVAFKVMRKSKLVDVGEAKHASEERRLHERVSRGPFINRLLASFQDAHALFLVLEYAPCGDLFQAMNFHGLPSRNDAVIFTIQVATALEHLHGLGYVYRDLKPENILLHGHGSVQLADFGMAKALRPGERSFTICGTAQYMSPEVLLHRGCYFEADLWAVGIFIYELVTGDTPFSSISGSRQDLYRRLMSHDPDHMVFPSSIDKKTSSVVKGLLQNEEHRRLGACGKMTELYKHPWFDAVDVCAVQRGSATPRLQPRRRNVIYDPALQRVLERGDVPWQRGGVVDDPAILALFEAF